MTSLLAGTGAVPRFLVRVGGGQLGGAGRGTDCGAGRRRVDLGAWCASGSGRSARAGRPVGGLDERERGGAAFTRTEVTAMYGRGLVHDRRSKSRLKLLSTGWPGRQRDVVAGEELVGGGVVDQVHVGVHAGVAAVAVSGRGARRAGQRVRAGRAARGPRAGAAGARAGERLPRPPGPDEARRSGDRATVTAISGTPSYPAYHSIRLNADEPKKEGLVRNRFASEAVAGVAEGALGEGQDLTGATANTRTGSSPPHDGRSRPAPGSAPAVHLAAQAGPGG